MEYAIVHNLATARAAAKTLPILLEGRRSHASCSNAGCTGVGTLLA
eukprot:CAMPEP_0178442834 /NCGR_PEP_ID=MMETSP0689_2-20121128/38452_1 /TAXON_ID=160604 /ORGANISM="Amphidinium massartii, Strain CS-259" /LENGTH=45 /DNA_ID= /DNA_START= /DNA_END= /DNA_ORIENTATION=